MTFTVSSNVKSTLQVNKINSKIVSVGYFEKAGKMQCQVSLFKETCVGPYTCSCIAKRSIMMHWWIVPPLPSTVVNTVIMPLQLFPWCVVAYSTLELFYLISPGVLLQWKKEWASSHTPRSNIAWECCIQWMAIPSISDGQSDKKGDINWSSKWSNQHFL